MGRERLYLTHILECIERVAEYTLGGRDAFFADAKTQDAVIRNIQVLAESARLVPESLKHEHHEVPWRLIAGLRNVLVHQYLSINLERVWEVVERDLPRLRQQIEPILLSLDEEP